MPLQEFRKIVFLFLVFLVLVFCFFGSPLRGNNYTFLGVFLYLRICLRMAFTKYFSRKIVHF